MKLLLVADSFPPMNSSSAIQLDDLCKELFNQKHQVYVVFPSSHIDQKIEISSNACYSILSISIPDLRKSSMVKRAITELSLSFLLIFRFRQTPWTKIKFDGVIWYSPSIFFGLFAWYIKYKNNCKGYLILRDIFPDWALDVGLLKKNFIYYFFKFFEIFQYRVANVIGIQTPGNEKYFQSNSGLHNKVEVLCNWLLPIPESFPEIDIQLQDSILSDKKIFVYAGNIGKAQNVKSIIDIAENLSESDDFGFLVVGRGTEKAKLESLVASKQLQNVLFLDEIDSEYIPSLYKKCFCGIVSLNVSHQSHNIPGKFVSYMHNSLPVFAMLNPGNDLADIIETKNVGWATFKTHGNELKNELLEFSKELVINEQEIRNRCKLLAQEMFSANSAASQIVKTLR